MSEAKKWDQITTSTEGPEALQSVSECNSDMKKKKDKYSKHKSKEF